MKIITTPKELNEYAKTQKSLGKTIGLVPTMGYLHDGHKSLIKKSHEQNDITIVSIFVNPTQFGVGEDLDTYPRDLEHDKIVAANGGADVIFHPEASDMYPSGYSTYVSVDSDMTKVLCGASRPIHFRGVTTVVSKLFNISMADRAYFGQKDAQQLAVIMQMVKDLNMNITIVPCPIVRENDGLAMSSRNTYLSKKEREEALVLSRGLRLAEDEFIKGERNSGALKNIIKDVIKKSEIAKIEYIESYTFPSLIECTDDITEPTLIALAVHFGTTRLIDNMILEP